MEYNNPDSSLNWYVLKIKPRREKSVENYLTDEGYTVYLPRIPSYRIGKNVKFCVIEQ
jgi:hypothetical protein